MIIFMIKINGDFVPFNADDKFHLDHFNNRPVIGDTKDKIDGDDEFTASLNNDHSHPDYDMYAGYISKGICIPLYQAEHPEEWDNWCEILGNQPSNNMNISYALANQWTSCELLHRIIKDDI